MIVIDAALVLSWVIRSEDEVYAQKVLEYIRLNSATMPSSWMIAVVNGLVSAEREAYISQGVIDTVLLALESLPITIEPYGQRYSSRIAQLARQHKISAYEAAYLECAQRMQYPLATCKKWLRAIAKKQQIKIFET